MSEKYLLAMDGSEMSKKAAEKTISLIKDGTATVDVLTVASEKGITYGMDPTLPDLIRVARMEDAEIVAKEAQQFFKEKGFEVETFIKVGYPAEEICNTASSGDYSMVIMGSSGTSGISRIIVGSVANEVLQCVSKPILIVK